MTKIKKYRKEDGTEIINDQTQLKFKNYSALLKPLVTIYEYFEAVNEPVNIEQEFKKWLKKNDRLNNEWDSYIDNINTTIKEPHSSGIVAIDKIKSVLDHVNYL